MAYRHVNILDAMRASKESFVAPEDDASQEFFCPDAGKSHGSR